MLCHCQRGRHLQTDHNRDTSTSLANFGGFSVAVISSRMNFLHLFLLPAALFVAVPTHEERRWLVAGGNHHIRLQRKVQGPSDGPL